MNNIIPILSQEEYNQMVHKPSLWILKSDHEMTPEEKLKVHNDNMRELLYFMICHNVIERIISHE